MKTIEEFGLANEVLKKLYISNVVISEQSQDLGVILKKHPKLVIALNHGPMAGALTGLIGLVDMFLKNGGAKRIPFGLTWRTFYEIPVTKQIFTYLTQVDHGLSFESASSLLSDNDFTDCFIMPEGELCNFGNGVDLQPFLSPRFVELAIRNNIPILVVVHQGAENWAWPLKINDKYKGLFNWLPNNMKDSFDQSGIISIPKPLKRKLNKVFMSVCLHKPSLKLTDLKEDKDQRLIQLTAESNKIRTKMEKMIAQVKIEAH